MSLPLKWEQVLRDKGLLAGAGVVPVGTHPYVQLTLPPSVNNLFVSVGKRRVKSPEYRAWIAANEKSAAGLSKPSSFPVVTCFKLCGKVNRQRDGYNAEKALSDLLVSVGVLPDDNLKYVTGGRWSYAPSDAEPCVLVWLEEVA